MYVACYRRFQSDWLIHVQKVKENFVSIAQSIYSCLVKMYSILTSKLRKYLLYAMFTPQAKQIFRKQGWVSAIFEFFTS